MSAAIKVTYHLLSNHADLIELVEDRIYANAAQQGVSFPFVVIAGVSRVESPTQDSDSAIDTHRVQIDLFAEDGPVLTGIAQLTLMAGYARNAMARITGVVNGVLVNGIQSAGEGDEYDDVLRINRKRLDFLIRLTNPI